MSHSRSISFQELGVKQYRHGDGTLRNFETVELYGKFSVLGIFIGRSYAQKYREDFYIVDWFNGSALHGDRGAACRKAHTNFADESACLTASNFRHEVVRIHR
jgi:hypothetical protein